MNVHDQLRSKSDNTVIQYVHDVHIATLKKRPVLYIKHQQVCVWHCNTWTTAAADRWWLRTQTSMDAEQALRLLGPYSRWQLRTYFMYGFGFGVPLAWMYMSVVFIGECKIVMLRINVEYRIDSHTWTQKCNVSALITHDRINFINHTCSYM